MTVDPRTTRLSVAGVAAVLLVLMPAASAAPAMEIDIIDAYLDTFDSPAPHGEHCLRNGGLGTTADAPLHIPLPGTNSLLDHHTHWHLERYRLLENGRPPAEESNPFGTEFVNYHRVKLAAYDSWRVDHGFDPVISWAPSEPVPAEFRYAKPGCESHKSEDPQVPLPTWATVEGGDDTDPLYGKRALCEFPTLNAFAKAIDDGYHTSVHGAVGGDMGPVWASPRDPLFWAWHRHVDDVFVNWETSCGEEGSAGSDLGTEAASATEAPVPSPTAAAFIALGLVALMLRRAAGRK